MSKFGFLTFLFTIFLTACDYNKVSGYDRIESKLFFEKISSKLTEKSNISLREVTWFDWEEVCFFFSGESAPRNLSFSRYEDYINNTAGIKTHTLKKRNYHLIVSFKNKNQIHAYGVHKYKLNIGGSQYWIGQLPDGNCLLNKNAHIRLKKNPQNIIFYSKEE